MIKVEGRGHNYGVLHIKVEQSTSLAQILDQLNIQNAQELINLGSIYLHNQRLTQWPTSELKVDDYLRIHSTPRRFATDQIDWKQRVLFTNDEFIILHKPHGIPCHPTVDNQIENCLNQLQETLNCSLFITHRLDVATEGLLLFAKTTEAQKYFNELLLQRQVHKEYQCLTSHVVSVGLKTHYMKVTPRAPKVVHEKEFSGGLICQLLVSNSTAYPDIDNIYGEKNGRASANFFLNNIELLTGRTHQIRAQLAALGAPIIGDLAYGSTLKIRFQSQFNDNLNNQANTDAIALCSVKLKFAWKGQEYSFSTKMTDLAP